MVAIFLLPIILCFFAAFVATGLLIGGSAMSSGGWEPSAILSKAERARDNEFPTDLPLDPDLRL